MTFTEATLQALIDKQEIHDAMMRHIRGIDRCDEELMRSVYHEDARDHHGPRNQRAWDFVSWFIPESRRLSSFAMHTVTNITIELAGDVASSESYFVAYTGRKEDGLEFVDAFGGRYVDDWERRDGKWGITVREVVHEWSRADAFGTRKSPLPAEEFVQGKRNREDLSYRAPGGLGDAAVTDPPGRR